MKLVIPFLYIYLISAHANLSLIKPIVWAPESVNIGQISHLLLKSFVKLDKLLYISCSFLICGVNSVYLFGLLRGLNKELFKVFRIGSSSE